MTEHYITLHYAPTKEAKDLYERLKADPKQTPHFMNWGNLRSSADPWVKENIVFENDALPDGRASDNIAERNPNWCEMTTIYWAWKNGDVKGSASADNFVQHSHYRKFLDIPEEIDDGRADIYVAQPLLMGFNCAGRPSILDIETGTKICHPLPSWNAMEDVLTRDIGWKGSILWDEWRKSRHMFAPMNVWKMKGSLFKEYCEWAFPLAFEIDAKVRESLKSEHWKKEYDTAYQRRWLSFIGERMFSWWCFCQHIGGVKVATVPVKIYENFKPPTDLQEREGK